MNKGLFLAFLFWSSPLIAQAKIADVKTPWTNETATFEKVFGEKGKTFIRENFDQPEQLAEDLKKHSKGGKRTDAVLIIQNGKLIFEKYGREANADQLHIGWSVSKSVMSLLYGIAYKEKRFQLDDSICKYSEPARRDLCKIKVVDVLQWASGLDWLEDYEKSGTPLSSSVLNLLYGDGHRDMARFVLGHKLVETPGVAWRYSSGDSILASHMLKKIWGQDNIQAVMREKLFRPIGVLKSRFETDPKGTIMGAAYLQVTPHDLARIGLFVLANGKWNGEQILDPTWIEFSKTPSKAYIDDKLDSKDKNMAGAHWWVNDPVKAHRESRSFDLPSDTIYAMGHWGQYLLIVPSMKLVAVRLGDCRDGTVTNKTFADSVAKLLGPP